MLGDLRHGVFTEIYGSGAPKIDVYRRGLQRAYLTDVGNKINPPPAGAAGAGGRGGGGGGRGGAAAPPANTGEIKMMLRGELKELDAQAAAAIKRTTDRHDQASSRERSSRDQRHSQAEGVGERWRQC